MWDRSGVKWVGHGKSSSICGAGRSGVKWLVMIRAALAVGQEWCEVAGHYKNSSGCGARVV